MANQNLSLSARNHVSETLRVVVEVPVVGFNRPVTVLISHDAAELPKGMAFLAPDTRRVEAFTSIHKGSNAYGSLSEEFFVCRDGDFEHNWTVLWVTLNADQAQDNVQRLEPFCALPSGWQPEDIEGALASFLEDAVPLQLEGMILMWAYANYATANWDDEFLAETKVNGGSLQARVSNLVIRAATAGNPVNLSWLGE